MLFFYKCCNFMFFRGLSYFGFTSGFGLADRISTACLENYKGMKCLMMKGLLDCIVEVIKLLISFLGDIFLTFWLFPFRTSNKSEIIDTITVKFVGIDKLILIWAATYNIYQVNSHPQCRTNPLEGSTCPHTAAPTS